ncbi:MAG: sulfite exporter TauE/SafE family protein [Steroidobacteraceae bacterium]
MHELALGTAFIAGVLGSTHCLAMCGGLATALGTARGGGSRWQPLLYQLGRILSYGLGGAIVGSLGEAAGMGFETSRWSEVLRLGTALIVVLIGLNIALGAGLQPRWLRAPERWGALVWRRLAPIARGRLPTQPALRALTMGLLWGWLPCGLVYSVLLAAAFAGGAPGGGATMIAFGLGTLPAMLGLSYAGARLVIQHGSFARLLGAVIVACGLWTASMPIAALSGTHQHGHLPLAMTAVGPQLPPVVR